MANLIVKSITSVNVLAIAILINVNLLVNIKNIRINICNIVEVTVDFVTSLALSIAPNVGHPKRTDKNPKIKLVLIK